jgi:hypothetical protein
MFCCRGEDNSARMLFWRFSRDLGVMVEDTCVTFLGKPGLTIPLHVPGG